MQQSELQDDMALVVVRTYTASDEPVVGHLYTDGLLAGQIPRHDTGSDIENIQDCYFGDEHNHLWVAELEGQVIGMIGVVCGSDHVGEIRRLRVRKAYQSSAVAERLVETALSHCRQFGCLKIVLDTRFDASMAIDLFDRFGFQHTRTKSIQDKDVLEFYLDLYRQPTQTGEAPNHSAEV